MVNKTRFHHTAGRLFGLLLLFILSSCQPKTTTNRVPVAKVMDKYLYLDEIKSIFPPKVSKVDSLAMAKSYIQTWVKTQLILAKAELNLTPEQLDISNQIENYRSSLLIYKYEGQMIKDKVDTLVKDDEIQKYYDLNTSNFMLEEPLVKAVFLKIPKTAPDIINVKKWYKSDEKEEIKKLDSYAYAHATKYDYFKDELIPFSIIINQLPTRIEDEAEYLKSNHTIEQEDKDFLYLVYIRSFNAMGSLSPFSLVKSKIKDIIVNKRRMKFLSDLENQIYNDAQDHDRFEIYDVNKK